MASPLIDRKIFSAENNNEAKPDNKELGIKKTEKWRPRKQF